MFLFVIIDGDKIPSQHSAQCRSVEFAEAMAVDMHRHQALNAPMRHIGGVATLLDNLIGATSYMYHPNLSSAERLKEKTYSNSSPRFRFPRPQNIRPSILPAK